MLRVRFDQGGPRAVYACGVLLDLLAVQWHEVDAGASADLVYGGADRGSVSIPTAGDEEAWDDPRPSLSTREGIPIVHRGDPPVSAFTSDGLGFDAFYATFALLTAPWERVDPRNEVATPAAETGWLARHGVLDRPLVHEYAAALGRLLQVPPSRPDPSVVLTHDVDENFAHLFAVRESAVRFIRDLRRGSPAALRRAAGLARRLARRGTDPNDRWDDWRSRVQVQGGSSTFFVAAFNIFDDGAGHFDVGYDVRHPAVVREIRSLAALGAEIGIHFSLQARRTPDQPRLERERLEEALGLEIRSARHHWWALGEQPIATLRAQQEAGIAIDCSFGFSGSPGFRRGIAVPFHAYDEAAGGPLAIWSLPTIAMDKAIVQAGRTPEDAVAELERLWSVVERVGGALVLDWHTHCLNPAALAGAGRVLLDFADRAAARGAVFRTPLELVAQAPAA